MRLGRVQRKTPRSDIDSYDSSFRGQIDERYAIEDRRRAEAINPNLMDGYESSLDPACVN